MAANNNILELVLAWDLAVPGNILAPDLRRKAALTYSSFKELPVLWADTCWITLSISRTQDLQRVPQVYQRSITAVLKAVHDETQNGFLVEIDDVPELVRLKALKIQHPSRC